VIGFTLAVSILTAAVFGGAPAIRAANASLRVRRNRFGRYLLAGQVAVSLTLLIGAGLFIRTLFNLRAIDTGFDGSSVVLASVNPSLSRYTPERSRAFYDQMLDRAARLPGVHSASIADEPLLGSSYIDGIGIEGHDVAVHIRVLSPGFFETMGIPLRMGRDFARSEPHKVAIINEQIARKYFPGRNPVGVRIGGGVEIIGVAASAKYRSIRDEIPDTLYLPLSNERARTLHVRASGNPAALAPLLREEVRSLDRDLPVKISLFSDLASEQLARERLVAALAGCFGGLALLLAAIGLYGVLAYSVERRTREIGIRMSLGAQREAVLWMVLRDSMRMVAAGIAIGVPASVWLSRLVTRQLFGVAPGDVATTAAATLVLVVVAGIAGFVPARRAAEVDPMVALRHD
jgi:predicted permease